MREKKTLPPRLTKEQWSSVDYAVIKVKDKEPTAITKQQEPIDFPTFQVNFETVKVVKEEGLPPQIQKHLRITDKRTGIIYDVDAYYRTREIRKILALAEEMRIKNIPFKCETITATEPTQEGKFVNITAQTTTTKPAEQEATLTIEYYHKGSHIRTATMKLQPEYNET